MDIKEIRVKTMEKTKTFNILPKKTCALILFDFEKPIKKKKYHKTEYIFYECRFLMKDNEKIPFGKHTIQMPIKTAWLQLYEYLEDNNLIDKKNICLKYEKINQHHYCWSIANKTDYVISPLLYYKHREMVLEQHPIQHTEKQWEKDREKHLEMKQEKDRERVPEEDIEEF